MHSVERRQPFGPTEMNQLRGAGFAAQSVLQRPEVGQKRGGPKNLGSQGFRGDTYPRWRSPAWWISFEATARARSQW